MCTAVRRVQFLYGTQETFAVTDDGRRTGSEPVSEGHYLDQIPATHNEQGVCQRVKGTTSTSSYGMRGRFDSDKSTAPSLILLCLGRLCNTIIPS